MDMIMCIPLCCFFGFLLLLLLGILSSTSENRQREISEESERFHAFDSGDYSVYTGDHCEDSDDCSFD
jgi:hypothetical protein